ncbi:MAG: DinB family protein [Planctomycetota bacterium]
MHVDAILDRLTRFPAALRAAAQIPEPEDRLYTSSPADWSIIEIVTHLADEEQRDFPVRILSTLRDPSHPWPPIDPEGWARDGAYRDRDLETELARFESARRTAIEAVRPWPEPDWAGVYSHPTGPLRAGDLFAAWCAHDALHLRQIAKRLFEITQRDASGFHTKYAGDW